VRRAAKSTPARAARQSRWCYPQGRGTPDALLGVKPLATGDLVLADVLRGFTSERPFRQARALLESFAVASLAGREVCVQAASNYRTLRREGVTIRKNIRKTIGTIIATSCIRHG
jgi:hypothetical protein